MSSKIIPISPTSMKCLNSTGSISGSNMKPNIVRHSSLRFEKKTGSGRYSRLGGGVNGMMMHGGLVQRSNSDNYSHSSGLHGHSNRLPRGGMNNPVNSIFITVPFVKLSSILGVCYNLHVE
ncbi:unnamed protein product [Schistosoma curassoni]|uniref:Heterogeneous nuclear ribonucleoproteins A2/B1 n=1 Tax=Schistosoma curassoni TaxID=6186 RepID=A0A183JP71_9TREM|nr:unnamed protein product [Schistosoma curassoni]